MKTIQTVLGIALGIFLMSGCGGGAGGDLSGGESIEGNMQPHKIDRQVLETLVKNNHGKGEAFFSVTNDDKSYIFQLVPYGDVKEHKQIYIDLDKSGESGYAPYEKEGIGAEYLLEDNLLFKYTGQGGFDWSWEYVSKLSSKIPINYFGDNVHTFDVQAVVLDEAWDGRYSSGIKRFTKIIDRNENQKYIDEEKEFYIANDSLNYYFSLPYGEGVDGQYVLHRQFFVDSDLNAETGYAMGADYLVENGMLFRYIGNGGYDWLWDEVDIISDIRPVFRPSTHQGAPNKREAPYIIVPKEIVSDWANKIKVKGVSFDKEWNEISSTVSGEYEVIQDDDPSIIKIMDMEGAISQDGTIIYTTTGYASDISDLNNIKFLERFQSESPHTRINPRQIEIADDLLFFYGSSAGSPSKIAIYDIANKEMKHIKTSTLELRGQEITTCDQYLYYFSGSELNKYYLERRYNGAYNEYFQHFYPVREVEGVITGVVKNRCTYPQGVASVIEEDGTKFSLLHIKFEIVTVESDIPFQGMIWGHGNRILYTNHGIIQKQNDEHNIVGVFGDEQIFDIDISSDNQTAYTISKSKKSLDFYDISDPAAPLLKTTITLPAYPENLEVRESLNRAYVTLSDKTTVVISILENQD